VRTSQARRRNPDWTADETVLLLDLYLRAPRASLRHPEVVALSTLLNEVARSSGLDPLETYRNPTGVAMKLRNLAQQDPVAHTDGKTGLREGGEIDADIWRRYAHSPEGLAREVDRILREWRTAPLETAVASHKSSRGPAPSFGAFGGYRTDADTIVYLLVLGGPLEALFPGRTFAPGWGVAKIGRSNDTARRITELSTGFPPGAAIVWRTLREYKHPGALSAHVNERALLRLADEKGWSIGGEFVIAPLDDLIAAAEAIVTPPNSGRD
jgi:hypothetical protein